MDRKDSTREVSRERRTAAGLARIRRAGLAGALAGALILGAWAAPVRAEEAAGSPPAGQSSEKKGDACEGMGILERLAHGCPPAEASYGAAPYSPMELKLHRPERFGVHLHNIEARYTDTIGMYTATDSGKSYNQFQIPAAEIEASGSILPGWLFAQVVIDPRDLLGRGLGDSIAANLKTNPQKPGGIVMDAFFDLLLKEPYVFLRIGQQRIPFGVEPQTPGGLLPFINRSFVDLKVAHNAGAESTAFADAELIQERDIGVQARGHILPQLDYAVGVFNGSGINVSDTNNSKDFIGRIGYAPCKGVRLGASGYFGTQTDILNENVNRNRVGLDLEVLPDVIPHLRLLAEGAAGHDGQFYRKAWYASAFYELIPQKTAGSPGLWLGARYEEMDDEDHFSRATFGLTYYFLNAVNESSGYWQQVKFQLNYEVRNHPTTASASPTDAFSKDLLMAQFTVRY